MQSFYSVWGTGAKTISERSFYDTLPEKAIIELPVHVLLEMEGFVSRHCGSYGFVLEDLLDDCLSNTSVEGIADESLEEWFDDTSFALSEAYGDTIPHIEYMNAIGKLFTHVQNTMALLYTPSGNHYYEFLEWLDPKCKTTAVLTKRRYVE